MDLVDVDELLKDDSFGEMDDHHLEDDCMEIFKQWNICGTFPSSSNVQAANSCYDQQRSGPKFIDTRTFTRPKKKLEHSFSNMSNLASETFPGENETLMTPKINLQIGGAVTTSMSLSIMQKSWLNDVSPPGSIISSMEMSANERMGNSLITSGDFTNVSFLLNNNAPEDVTLGPQSNFNGYRLSDVIKDRNFLENLSMLDDNTLTKDCSLSRTDMNGIIDASSGCTTMQNSVESIPSKSNKQSFEDTFDQLNYFGATVPPTEPLPPKNTTFDANFENKNQLNGTFDANPVNGTFTRRPKLQRNDTYDKEPDDLIANTTFGVGLVKNNETFGLVNKTAVMFNGCNGSGDANLTYDHKDLMNESPIGMNNTFDRTKNVTAIRNDSHQLLVEDLEEDFESPENKTAEKIIDLERDSNLSKIVQSTPFTKVQPPGYNRHQPLKFEPNISPITTRKSRANSRNTSVVIRRNSLDEDDDFDVEIRRINTESSPRVPSTIHSGNPFDDKRISLQSFEAFEKSIENDNDFDKMLNNFSKDTTHSADCEKMRQSLDHIKKRHSLMNLEKQQEEMILKKKEIEVIDNRLLESMNRSMNSSGGSERLLNRRSRIYEDVSVTPSPPPLKNAVSADSVTEQIEESVETTNGPPEVSDPPSTENVESADRKNRDRFKTIRINRKREDGIPRAPEIEHDPQENNNDMEYATEFSKVDMNSPKVFEDCFKMPQAIVRPESKLRSLSKPRAYGTMNKKDMSLPLSNRIGSTDNLENNKPEQYSQPTFTQRIPAKQNLAAPTANLKSPMGTKSKSIHNLVFNSSNSQSNSNLNKIPSKIGSVGSKLSSYGYNNELKSNASKIQSNLRLPRASSLVRPATSSKAEAIDNNTQLNNQSKSNSQLPTVNLRATNTKRLGLVRPSSGYFSYSSSNNNSNNNNSFKKNDSDNESVHSLSSSSASSRGSLYRVDSHNVTNNHVQMANSIEDISVGTIQKPQSIARPSGLKAPTSMLRPPSARSVLPRPSSYIKR